MFQVRTLNKWVFLCACIASLPLTAAEEIQNEISTRGRAKTLVFEEDLRLTSKSGGDEFLWTNPDTKIAVSKDGQMFVLDIAEGQVLQFDTKGNFVKVFAPKGMGPGEVQSPTQMGFLKDGSAYISEIQVGTLPKTNWWDAELNYKETKPASISNMPAYFAYSPNGKYTAGIVAGLDQATGTLTTRFILGDKDFNIQQNISEFTTKIDPSMFQSQDGFATFMASQLNNALRKAAFATFLADGTPITAKGTEYRITKWSKDCGTPQTLISKKHKPIPFTEKEMMAILENRVMNQANGPLANLIKFDQTLVQKVFDKADIPTVNPPINQLLPMENSFLVLREISFVKNVQKADIFDEKGHFVGEVEVDDWAFVAPDLQPRMIFQNGYAYTMEYKAAEEELELVRYKYSLEPK